MRRGLKVVVCLAILAFVGAGTALAKGPHHRGGYGGGYRPPVHAAYRGGWNGHRHCRPAPPVCGRPVAAYPVVPAYPAAVGYPQFGFGVASRNFSLFFQQ